MTTRDKESVTPRDRAAFDAAFGEADPADLADPGSDDPEVIRRSTAIEVDPADANDQAVIVPHDDEYR